MWTSCTVIPCTLYLRESLVVSMGELSRCQVMVGSGRPLATQWSHAGPLRLTTVSFGSTENDSPLHRPSANTKTRRKYSDMYNQTLVIPQLLSRLYKKSYRYPRSPGLGYCPSIPAMEQLASRATAQANHQILRMRKQKMPSVSLIIIFFPQPFFLSYLL